jgi:formylglycine-generating enzyme required for sulfatase activity
MACGEVEGGLEGKSSNGGGPARQSSSGNNAAISSSSVISINDINWLYPPSNSYVHGMVEKIQLSPFLISEYLITQGQYKEVMGAYPSGGIKNDNSPVDGVTWFKAVEFCEKFSELTGWDIRLPTEAQWEYTACWTHEYVDCPPSPTIETDPKYWEWTKDCFDSKFPYQFIDPSAPPNCLLREGKVRKGFVQSFDARFLTDPALNNIGGAPISFRVVRMGSGF